MSSTKFPRIRREKSSANFIEMEEVRRGMCRAEHTQSTRSAFSLEEKEKSLHRFFAFFRSTNGNQKMVFPHTPHNVCSSLAPSFITAFFTPQSLSLSLVFRTDSSGSSSSLSAFWVLSQRSRADFKASHCSLLDRKQRRTQC